MFHGVCLLSQQFYCLIPPIFLYVVAGKALNQVLHRFDADAHTWRFRGGNCLFHQFYSLISCTILFVTFGKIWREKEGCVFAAEHLGERGEPV